MESLLTQYEDFVDGVTSNDSKVTDDFIKRIEQLKAEGWNVARLGTAALGLSGEAGEFADLVKKILYHGKPLDKENEEKLIKELGDVAWYWVQGCIALKIDPEDVIVKNIKKLESRYPGGRFSVARSENRNEEEF